MDITLYTNKVTTTSTNSTHRVQLDFDINWEYALALCPSDLIHAELHRRHKASKMSGVLIIEPIPHESDGSPATFEFTDEPTRIAGVDFELPNLSILKDEDK